MQRGVVGAVVCAVALGVLWAVTVPAYWPVDELSHVPYARAVVAGRLPTIDTPVGPTGLPGIAERLAFERAAHHEARQDIWTANHPPLYFLLAGLPLVIGETVGAPGLGFLAARGVSVLAAALGVTLTAAIARLLVPHRPRVAVAAAAFAALTPSLSHFSGLVFNDTMSFAVCTLLLLFALTALRDGPDGRLLVVGLAGSAAALTRVAALPLIVLAAVACAAGAWRHASGQRSLPALAIRSGDRLRAALRAGGVAAVLPALGAGWFYLRNWQRYGEPTGARALLAKFGRDPNASLDDVLLHVRFYVRQWDRLLGDLSTGVWVQGWRMPLIRGLGVAILVGLTVAGVRAAHRRFRVADGARRNAARQRWVLSNTLDADGWSERGWRRWAWVLALAFPTGLLLATARFHAQGGSAHARYLLSAMAVIAVVAACGLDALGRSRGSGQTAAAWPMLAGLGTLVVLGVGVWIEFLHRGGRMWIDDGRVYPLRRIGESWNDAVIGAALVVLAVGIGLIGRALVDLSSARLTSE